MNVPPAASKELSIRAVERAWQLSRPADLESLWDTMGQDDFGDDERLPYWTEIWPSSLALADWLAANRARFQGRRCLDIGCGLGLTALIGQWLGGRVTAMDYEPAAVAYAQSNERANGISGIGWLAMDWREPSLRRASFDFIWGGDVMYESRFATPIADFFLHTLAPGGIAWLAEPGRTVYQTLVDALFRRGISARRVHTRHVDENLVNPVPVDCFVWEIQKAPAPTQA